MSQIKIITRINYYPCESVESAATFLVNLQYGRFA